MKPNPQNNNNEIDLGDNANESENSKKSKRIFQSNLQDKFIPLLSPAISLPIDNKERRAKYLKIFKKNPTKFSNILKDRPELKRRLRNKGTSDNEVREDIPVKEQANSHWIWISLLLLTFCVIAVYMMFLTETEQHFFENFVDSTTKLVENIIQVDISSSDETVIPCLRFANIVENNPAFEKTGSSIAKYLREFSERIMELNNEISEMMSKLNPNLFERLLNETYFRSHMSKLIEEFREKITAIKKVIFYAEFYGDFAEKKVRQGITEATKFIPNNHEYKLKLNEENYYLEKIHDDISNAIDDAENVLIILEKSLKALDFINKNLIDYRNKLFDVEKLGKIKKNKITKKDLEKLKKLVKFIRKDTKIYL
ncbi:hypothetical protein C1645_534734 [Glomus cerebriforme]|uniref:Uncharacterized protein n=1 Tax=Glomus cerebriforme TaxID=658196 RepID=A0A397TEQ2_9GLOM|nr:hypothetical protein C1645_534734 [Glomus cerebriforme]